MRKRIFVMLAVLSMWQANGFLIAQESGNIQNEQRPSALEVLNKWVAASGSELALESLTSLQLSGETTQISGDLNWTHQRFIWQAENWVFTFFKKGDDFLCGEWNGRVWSDSEMDEPAWKDHGNRWWFGSYDVNPLRAGKWQELSEWFYVSGAETIDGQLNWQLEFHADHRVHLSFWFNAETGLLTRSRHIVHGSAIDHQYADYRTVDGLTIPFQVHSKAESSNLEWRWDLETVAINEPAPADVVFLPQPLVDQPKHILTEGKVQDLDTGKPVAGARILVRKPRYTSEVVVAITDRDGRFQIFDNNNQWRHDHPLEIHVQPRKFQPYISRKFEVPKGERNLDLKFKPTRILRGQIINKATGSPVQGRSYVNFQFDTANPRLQEWYGRSAVSTETDLQGRFSLPVAEGTGKLRIRADLSGKYEFQNDFWNYANEIEVKDDRIGTTLKIVLQQLPSVKIEVRRSDGTLAGKLAVTGDLPSDHNQSKESLSNTKSRVISEYVEVFGLEQGQQRKLFVFHPESGEGKFQEITGGREQYDPIQLEPAAILRGRFIIDQTLFQKPVRITAGTGSVEIASSNVTDDGSFELKLLPGVAYKLTIETTLTRRYHRPVMKRVYLGRLESGQTKNAGELDLLAEFSLQGIVVDAKSGKPVAGVTIGAGRSGQILGEENATTDANGKFRVDWGHRSISRGSAIAPSWKVIPPSGSKFLPAEFESSPGIAEFGPKEARIELKLAKMYKGRVVDARSGKPVSALVQFVPQGVNPVSQRNSSKITKATTDEQGRFQIPVSGKPGKLRIRAGNKGAFDTAVNEPRFNYVHDINLEKDEPLDELEVKLTPKTAASIAVVLEDGKPAINFVALGESSQAKGLNAYLFIKPDGGANKHAFANYSNAVPIYDTDDGSERIVVLLQREKSLGAFRIISEKKTEMENFAQLTLQSCGTIRGKIKSNSPIPLNSVNIGVFFEFPGFQLPPMGSTRVRHKWISVSREILKTDGSFEIENVIPDTRCRITFGGLRHSGRGRVDKELVIDDEITAGQELDLGELDLNKLDDEK